MVKPFLVERNDGKLHLSWNLNANVGFASPNRQDDVELVQLGYFIMGKRKLGAMPTDLLAMMAAIRVGSICTGRMDDPLVQLIFAHQKHRKSTVDGRVSVISNSTGTFGGETYLLGSLINNIFADQPELFPRVDKHPRCGSTLRQSVIEGVAHM